MTYDRRTASGEEAARRQDETGEFYRAFDPESGLWGVFGTESGYCYETLNSDGHAYERAEEMTAERRADRIRKAKKRKSLR